jgi:WD40 repeat protein
MRYRQTFHIPFLLFSCAVCLVLAACSPISSDMGSATPTRAKTTPAPPSPGKTLLIYKDSGVGPTLSAAWSPDGKSIASGGFNGVVKLWNVATGKTLRTYSGFQNAFTSNIVWSHDGQRIAVGTFYPISQDASAYILDAHSQKILLVSAQYHMGIADLAWSPDGKFIASSKAIENTPQVEITIWNTATHHVASVYELHSDLINSLSWSADSTSLLLTSRDKTVMIWDVATGKTRQLHKEQTGDVYSAAWSPNGKLVALAGKDQMVHVFEADTGKTIFIYKEHKSSIYSVAWSRDGKLIASSDDAGTVRVWSAP